MLLVYILSCSIVPQISEFQISWKYSISLIPLSGMSQRKPYHHLKVFEGEESRNTEFKAHMSLSLAELNQYEITQRLFQPASKTLCAFLNINQTCKLYLGIKDDGRVSGHPMLAAQKAHFRQALDTLFTRDYEPSVEDYRYNIEFIPVIMNPLVHYKPEKVTVKAPHTVLTNNRCWCMSEQNTFKDDPQAIPHYVIEVSINPWVKGQDEHAIWPYYTNEERKCYTRYSASTHEVDSVDEIIRNTLNDRDFLRKGLCHVE